MSKMDSSVTSGSKYTPSQYDEVMRRRIQDQNLLNLFRGAVASDMISLSMKLGDGKQTPESLKVWITDRIGHYGRMLSSGGINTTLVTDPLDWAKFMLNKTLKDLSTASVPDRAAILHVEPTLKKVLGRMTDDELRILQFLPRCSPEQNAVMTAYKVAQQRQSHLQGASL